jgi:phosphate-selective porin OprO/OprP
VRCPPDDNSLPCALRRFDAAARKRLSTGPILDFTYHGFVMLDFSGPDSDLNGGQNVQVRRARIGFDRPFDDKWTLRGDIELKTGRFELEDVYLRRTWDGMQFYIGNQTEPFGLERVTGSQYTMLLERSLPLAFAPGYDVGARLADRSGDWFWTAGLFGAGSSNDGLRSKGYAVDGRLVWSRSDDDSLRHFGAAVSLRPQSSEADVRFRSYPEIAVSNVYLVDTGEFANVSNVRRYGFEYAEVHGPWSWQGEAITTRVLRTDGLPALTFHGSYVELSWFPWQGMRHYDPKEAKFVSIGDVGREVFEFTARLSHIDLTSQEIDGGRETNATLGANWYVTSNVRLGLNYIRVLTLQGGPFHGVIDNHNTLLLRLQYDVF